MDRMMDRENHSDQPGHSVSLKVRYYETDQMGIVHHSNYIRWFEVARTDYLRAVGLPYRELEASGTISPVIGISCDYLQSARYDDEIAIRAWVTGYTGVRLQLSYEVTCDGVVLCRGKSEHAFVHGGRPVAPKRTLPHVHQILSDCLMRDSRVM
ncbi:MAG: thioesterase family protein [Eubacteriales bacterium]|nr:thioesterase family protein [Eubacteriales bacterium]